MASYYVREQGASIHKVDQRLVVRKAEQDIAQIPLHHLTQLTIMGYVQLTTQAMHTLLNAQVDVVFMSLAGRVVGRLLHDDSKFAELRVKQLQMANNADANFQLALQIFSGKLSNQASVLKMQTINQPAMTAAIRNINEMLRLGQQCNNADSLRGYEGKAASYYWPAFRKLLKYDWGFTGREYNPPPDPVNALLSFCYGLLRKDVTASVKLVGLDTHIGFFHTLYYGRPSLALDLMEEFRPIVVDVLVLDLINRERLGLRDFTHPTPPAKAAAHKPAQIKALLGDALPPKRDHANAPGQLGWQLKETPLARVIQAYGDRLDIRMSMPINRENTALRRCIELQTRQLARVIKGEVDHYVPFTLDLMSGPSDSGTVG